MSTVIAEGSEWDTLMTEQGMAYYHNRRTGETTWERPVLAAGTSAAAPLQAEESPRYFFLFGVRRYNMYTEYSYV